MHPLWEHQKRTKIGIRRAVLDNTKRILVASPTGSGKTMLAASTMADYGKHSWYTHRRMLFEQTVRAFREAGLDVGLRAAGEELSMADIQVCMRQSEHTAVVKKGSRPIHKSDIFWIDECHHQKAGQMSDLAAKHGGAFKVGLTATPLGLADEYDHLIVGAVNSELRLNNTLLLAREFAPLEPGLSLIGKVEITDGGTCGITSNRRKQYAQKIYGHLYEHIQFHNPLLNRPMILFAPDVPTSKWIAMEMTKQGIRSAHIDGRKIWIDGEVIDSKKETRAWVAEESKAGRLPLVCNRFVMREGIDWPWLQIGLFATVFGSLTAYLQAGGRLLRGAGLMEDVTVLDFGGNWWRHGSLNADWNWNLFWTDRIVSSIRMHEIRTNQRDEPIRCPACGEVREYGTCPCGHQSVGATRKVIEADGKLKEQKVGAFAPRRIAPESMKKKWAGMVCGVAESDKVTCDKLTFSQLAAKFALDNENQWPSREWEYSPESQLDWYRPIKKAGKLK